MASRTSELILKLVDNVSTPARSVEAALAAAEAKVKEISSAMGEGVPATDRLVNSLLKLGATGKDIEQVAAAWRDYTKASGLAGESSDWTKGQAAAVRSWETSTVSSVRAVLRERQNETAAMRNLAREQNEILTKQADDQKKIRKEAGSFAGGMIGMGLGFAGITGAKDVIKAAANLADQQRKLASAAKSDPSEVPFAQGLAADIAKKYPNISTADALEMYNEIRAQSAGEGGMVDREKAKRNLGLAAKTKTGLANLGVDFTAADAQSLQKALESSGRAMDPTAFDKLTDAYTRAKQVYGTAVTAEAFNTAIQNAKASNYSLGDNEFYRKTWARIAEGNSARYGNEQNQTLATLVGGHATKQTAQWLVAHGLADSFTPMGGGAARINGLRGSNVLQTDQGDWATGFLLPALKDALSPSKVTAREQELRADALKANPNAQIDDKALNEKAVSALVAAEVQKMGVRGTVADNLTKWIVGQALVDRDSKLMDNAGGRDWNAEQARNNPTVALAELAGAVTNFASVVGGPLMTPAAHALDSMAHSIENFTKIMADWEKAHPDLAKVASGAALGTGTVLSGAALIGALGKGLGTIGRVFGIGGGGGSAAAGAAAGGGGLLAGAAGMTTAALLNLADAAGNQGIADILKRAHPGMSDDDMRAWAKGQLAPPAFEIRRPGRDVHSPSTGPYSYTPASVDTSSLDNAVVKAGNVAAAVGAIPTTARINIDVDTGVFDAAMAKIRSGLASIHALGGGGGMGPSLGSTHRGYFSSGGINGE